MSDAHLRVVLITLGDPSQLTGGYLFHRRLAELAPRHGASLEFASFRSSGFPFALMETPSLLASVERGRPDVIVVDSIIAWCLALQGPRLPAVGMLHQPPGGIDFGPVRTSIQAVLDRLAYRHLQRLLVASESLADVFDVPVFVVPPGRDVAAGVAQSPGDLRYGRRSALLCVGNWVERKGILTLLEAFAGLEPDAATLHLVGRTDLEGGYTARIKIRLAHDDLAQRVVVHGPLAVGEVAAMYAAADAFVLPSLKEPYGTVYGEAMAFGLPVVGWRAGNLPYLAEDGKEGLMVTPGDVAGLTDAMRRLADDEQLRLRLGANARQRAMARPTWEEVAALFFGHLRQVTGR